MEYVLDHLLMQSVLRNNNIFSTCYHTWRLRGSFLFWKFAISKTF